MRWSPVFGVDIMVMHLCRQGTVTATVGISISLTHFITEKYGESK